MRCGFLTWLWLFELFDVLIPHLGLFIISFMVHSNVEILCTPCVWQNVLLTLALVYIYFMVCGYWFSLPLVIAFFLMCIYAYFIMNISGNLVLCTLELSIIKTQVATLENLIIFLNRNEFWTIPALLIYVYN